MATKVFKAGGREFKIKKVYIDKEKDELLVSGRLKRPDDKCVVTQELNSIVDLVAISKTEKNITFETLIETYICE